MNNSQIGKNVNSTNTKEMKEKKSIFEIITKETWSKVTIILSLVSIVFSIVALCVTLSRRRPPVDRHFAYDRQQRVEQRIHPNFDRPSNDGPSFDRPPFDSQGSDNNKLERPQNRKKGDIRSSKQSSDNRIN